MANHVENTIYLEQGNDAVQTEWQKLFVEYGEKTERPSYHGDGTVWIWEYAEIQKHPFLSGYTEDNWYQWGCDNIGAKWAHLDDADEYCARIVSAWSPVQEYVEKLYNHLGLLDNTVSIRHTYEDEYRNFIGVGKWFDNEFEEANLDTEDLSDVLTNKFSNVDDEDFDWDYDEKTDCCPAEWYDDWICEWFSEAETWH